MQVRCRSSERRDATWPACGSCLPPTGSGFSAVILAARKSVWRLAGGSSPLGVALRQWQLRELADGVAVRLETKAGRGRQREEAFLRGRQTAIELPHEFHRQIVVFNHTAMREAGVQVHIVERPGAAIVDRHVEGGRESRDLEALRDAAADCDVWLQHVDRLREQQVAEAEQ